MHIIPFSSAYFFAVAAIMAALAYAVRPFAARHRFPFDIFILLFSSAYWIFCLRDYVAAAAIFMAYEYAVIKLYGSGRISRPFGVVLMIVPMVLYKINLYQNAFFFIGISFMTFRTLQFLFDAGTKPRPVRYMAFLLFFPTILSGPIDRFRRFETDLESGYSNMNANNFVTGWRFVMLGILQKFIVAESINTFILAKLSQTSTSLVSMSQNAAAYSAYLYFDFAGYSMMAIGLSFIFGVLVPQNFNHPYLAQNPVEFWRRWHISLGEWLRDYIFMPTYKFLLTRAKGAPRQLLCQNIALYVTFQLMGLWNGFELRYIVEGMLFGIYSMVYNSYIFHRKMKSVPAAVSNTSHSFAARVTMCVLAIIALYVFSGRCPYFG